MEKEQLQNVQPRSVVDRDGHGVVGLSLAELFKKESTSTSQRISYLSLDEFKYLVDCMVADDEGFVAIPNKQGFDFFTMSKEKLELAIQAVTKNNVRIVEDGEIGDPIQNMADDMTEGER